VCVYFPARNHACVNYDDGAYVVDNPRGSSQG
jgi:hypothetical protein